MKKIQKTLLISIDGWGHSDKVNGNAIFEAKTPVMDSLKDKKESYCLLNASGLDVGLPENVMGNSEVGHLTMGTGRELYTDLVKINKSIKDKSLRKNLELVKALEISKKRNSNVHFMGLLSDGGVHSHIDHLCELINIAKEQKVPNLFVHGFLDGRDTSPNSSPKYIKRIMNFLEKIKFGKLSTLIGRFYAMDRDKRWERIQKAYDLLVSGKGEKVEYKLESVCELIEKRYSNKIFDETSGPIDLLPEGIGKIKNGDVLIFFDFRSDRMRQIVETFGVKTHFDTEKPLNNLSILTMTEYSSNLKFPIMFPPDYVKNSLSEIVSKNGLKQFHVAETEKYAHVTFFFNGRNEKPFKNEERKLITSPFVKTYDMKPEMSMPSVTNNVIGAMEKEYSFIMCNFAPPDMVGHTGNYKATVKACEETDKCVGMCIKGAEKYDYVVMVTSDHGNAEEMIDEKGNPKTSHNCNRVPLAVITPSKDKTICLNGTEKSSLKDVAPTICEIMGLEIPEDFTGKSLLVK